MKKRNTSSKNEIYSLLKSSDSAMNYEMIQQNISQKMNRSTIYRILNSFSEDGIVHVIVADDGKLYFKFCHNCIGNNHHHNHFHFHCLKCGRIECLPKEINIEIPNGYVQYNFNAVISGICSKCTTNKVD